MATDRPELPVGLLWRRASIHIDTTVADRRVCRSCKTANPAVARQQLDAVRGQLQMAALTGVEAPILRERHLLDPFVVRELGRMAMDGVRESTRRRYASVMCAFVAFLTKHLGRAPRVDDITHDALSAWKDQAVRTPRVRNGRARGLGRLPAGRTIAGELDIIRTFTRRAVKCGMLLKAPVDVTRPRGAYAPRVRWLDDPELTRLLEAAYTWDAWAPQRGEQVGRLYGLVIETYVRTGLRLEELRHLTIVRTGARDPQGRRQLVIESDVCPIQALVPVAVPRGRSRESEGAGSRLRGLKRLSSHLSVDPAHAIEVADGLQVAPCEVTWNPKTRGRRIPLSPKAEAVLEELFQLRAEWLAQGDGLWAIRRQFRLQEPPWLIPNATGLPWRFKMARIMAACSKQARIVPVVRTHDLRHTFATHLRRSGVPLETLQELLGHASIEETQVYAHVTAPELSRAIDLIDRVALPQLVRVQTEVMSLILPTPKVQSDDSEACLPW